MGNLQGRTEQPQEKCRKGKKIPTLKKAVGGSGRLEGREDWLPVINEKVNSIVAPENP
jgi:hypothetical protein